MGSVCYPRPGLRGLIAPASQATIDESFADACLSFLRAASRSTLADRRSLLESIFVSVAGIPSPTDWSLSARCIRADRATHGMAGICTVGSLHFTKPGYSGTLHIDALLYGATAQMATTVKLADVLRSAKDDKLYAALSHCNASDACRRRPCPSRLG